MMMKHHGVYVSTSTSRRQTEGIGAYAELVQNEQVKAQLLHNNSGSESDLKRKNS